MYEWTMDSLLKVLIKKCKHVNVKLYLIKYSPKIAKHPVSYEYQ
jgi:hypothetical protein